MQRAAISRAFHLKPRLAFDWTTTDRTDGRVQPRRRVWRISRRRLATWRGVSSVLRFR